MLEIRYLKFVPANFGCYFEVDFSLYCHYAGETVLEDLNRVVASDPFNTG